MNDTYFLAYHILNIIFYCFFGISFLLMLFKIILHIISFFPAKKFPPAKKDHKFAIIIPARNESKVINQILDSIKAQNYNKDLIDTYLIVESEQDPTCQIAKTYEHTHVFVRKHLERKGKGYALDELFQEILFDKNTKYEAYFIFDADNILDPNYIAEMNKLYDKGYDIGVGYRNSKNWNDNWIAACSGITFATFNTFDNKPRSKLGLIVNICGTGFYISSRLLKKIGGYKFFTLTEDYEFKLYSTLNGVSSSYNENAQFYDEQPIKLKVSWNQRLRWCKGFSQANKIYSKQILKSGIKDKNKNSISKLNASVGVIPMIVTLVSIVCYQISNIVMTFVGVGLGDPRWYKPLIGFAASAVALYLFLCLYTLVIILLNRKNINFKFKNALICVLTYPLFLYLYIPIFITSHVKKEVQWVPIERTILTQTQEGGQAQNNEKTQTTSNSQS